jgi:hypothetical protein
MNFDAWWEQHGQFCRAGGGSYEKTFAFRAWEAAHEECAKLCESEGAFTEEFKMAMQCASAIRERIK